LFAAKFQILIFYHRPCVTMGCASSLCAYRCTKVVPEEHNHQQELIAQLQQQVRFAEEQVSEANSQKTQLLDQLQRLEAQHEFEIEKQQDDTARLVEDKLQAENELQEARSALDKAEKRLQRLLEAGIIAQVQVSSIRDFAKRLPDSPQSAECNTLEKSIKDNEYFCRKLGFHLKSKGHKSNIPQLYQFLVEEVFELTVELKRGKKGKAKREVSDVLSYALQFIWELNLQEHFYRNDQPGTSRGGDLTIELSESFLSLQKQIADKIVPDCENPDDCFLDVEIGKLEHAASQMADSVRANTKAFDKYKNLSRKKRKEMMAKSIQSIIIEVARLTVLFQIDMSDSDIVKGTAQKMVQKFNKPYRRGNQKR